jgi:hypothetical protein
MGQGDVEKLAGRWRRRHEASWRLVSRKREGTVSSGSRNHHLDRQVTVFVTFEQRRTRKCFLNSSWLPPSYTFGSALDAGDANKPLPCIPAPVTSNIARATLSIPVARDTAATDWCSWDDLFCYWSWAPNAAMKVATSQSDSIHTGGQRHRCSRLVQLG